MNPLMLLWQPRFMSVYICVVDPNTHAGASGLEISSGEFEEFRSFIAEHFEDEFPVFMGFDVSDGVWTLEQARALAIEVTLIEMSLRQIKIPRRLLGKAMKRARVRRQEVPRSMNEYFIAYNGQPMAMRLRLLAKECIEVQGTIRSQ